MADGLKIALLSPGHANPSSSIVNGAGVAGSAYVGDTIILSANDVGGIAGIGGLTVFAMPILRRRFASIIRKVNA